MSTRTPTFLATLAVVTVLVSSVAAPTKRGTGSPSTSTVAQKTNTIPQSTYAVPGTRDDGRDPFFPDRLSNPVITKQSPAPRVLELKLNGLSGPAEGRLAIINNKTFAEGEENEIVAGGLRLRIRCVSISADSVTIELPSGEHRELRLRD